MQQKTSFMPNWNDGGCANRTAANSSVPHRARWSKLFSALRVRLTLKGPVNSDDGKSDAETDLLPPETLGDDLMLTGLRPQRPWDAIYEMAENCNYGLGDHIQDCSEALKLYQDAARLGSSLAYEKIGDIFAFGAPGIKEDISRAVRYYKEGTKKGNYFCWSAMASLFANNNQMDNCTKCFARYFRERSESFAEEVEEYPEKHVGCVYGYIRAFLDHDLQPEFESNVSADAEAVEEYARRYHHERIAHRDHTDLGDSDGYKEWTLRPLNWLIDQRRGDTRQTFSLVPTPQAVERLAPPPVTRPKRWWRR